MILNSKNRVTGAHQSLLMLCVGVLNVLAGCSGDDGLKQAFVKGQITVADSVDSSKDYSGIGVAIIKKDSVNMDADTLFYAATDQQGKFSGEAEFSDRRQYLLIASRNNQNIGRAGVILAEGDTVQISAQLPGFNQTLRIKSREHKALESFQRVERSFQRIGAFARAGRLTGDSLMTELKKWPGIYWQIYEDNPETLAGHLAAKKSIELLSQWDQPAMMTKIEAVESNDDMVYLAATYGKEYTAKNKNLQEGLNYLDELETKTKKHEALMRIAMERIDLLYDSARTEKARTELESFKKAFDESEFAREWAQSVSYDLKFLAAGDPLPDFKFTDSGKEISREIMKGRPYLVEITSLANPLYQQQFDRSVVIHNIYKHQGFEILTLPLDTSDVTVQAFFEERVKLWPVASANTFRTQELIERFNIKNLPTRFLVDRDGRIVHRYVGEEYSNVIEGIQKTINKQ